LGSGTHKEKLIIVRCIR